MIKFFRQIRQTLIMENKTTKYFKYAIGEIILVVIGILIALQINNWNENNKLKKQEKELLANVLIHLQQDAKAIESVKKTKNMIFKVHEDVFLFTESKKDTASVGDLDLLRRTFPEKLITKENNPNLSNQVTSQKLKNQILKYFRAIDLAEFVMENNNLLIENKVRPFLAEKKLLKYGSQLQIFKDIAINIIDRQQFFEAVLEEDLQQVLIESGIKLYSLQNWEENAKTENEMLKQKIIEHLE